MSRKPKSHFCQANYPAEYTCWTNMKQRCYNPKHSKYAAYGGRGITVCERWLRSFHNFMEDIGPRSDGLSLERKDVDGNYEPANCKWATPAEQAANKRSHLQRSLERKQERTDQIMRTLGMY